jgi:hypothetical protein
MKKTLAILAIATLFSCQKEEIKPGTHGQKDSRQEQLINRR